MPEGYYNVTILNHIQEVENNSGMKEKSFSMNKPLIMNCLNTDEHPKLIVGNYYLVIIHFNNIFGR